MAKRKNTKPEPLKKQKDEAVARELKKKFARKSARKATEGEVREEFHAAAVETSDATPGPLDFPVVGIGASAGGIEAFLKLLQNLPPDTGMAYVLILHLAADRESFLPEIIGRHTEMTVQKAESGMAVKPNNVYVIPPATSIGIVAGKLRLMPRLKNVGKHLPVDFFFRCLSEDQRGNAIGVILSGADGDGANGLRAIKAEGGITFVQDPLTAKVSGMPDSAIRTVEPVDFVLSPEDIAAELTHLARHPIKGKGLEKENEEIGKIFYVLKTQKSVDFAGYKQATIERRIRRRMVIHRIDSLANYYKLIRTNPGEIELLYNDLLINVTNFFRDPEAFENLRHKVFKDMVHHKVSGSALRLWVPGCSTGEEAYSLAMSLIEFQAEMGLNFPIQIFGTDLSDLAIDRARSGHYTQAIQMDVSQDRLRRFFQRSDTGFVINSSVRDLCVFARHDLTRDPPFSRMDMISCRNLLIYLGPAVQKQVLNSFNYALNPEGFLFLGRSESVGASSNSFSLIDKRDKIYRKKAGQPWTPLEIPSAININSKVVHPGRGFAYKQDPAAEIQDQADKLILQRYSPVGAVLNEDFYILQFRGQTGKYFEAPPGEPNLNVLRMARGDLQFELRDVLRRAKRTQKMTRKENLHLDLDGERQTVHIEVVPLDGKRGGRGYVLLIEQVPNLTINKQKPVPRPASGEFNRKLKEELVATREYLNSNIKDLESANEELQSANEEILSSNEELQSTNEELGTAKEELQSVNEELTTVNEELSKRNQQLSEANNDLNNLLNNVNLPIVMVGGDLRIRRFTTNSEKLLNVIPTDIGRSIMDLRPNIELPNLEQLIFDTLDTMVTREIEIRDRGNRLYSLRVRPYRTPDNRIDGAVLIFIDLGAG